MSIRKLVKKNSLAVSIVAFLAVIGVTFAVVNSQRSLDDRSRAATGDSNNIFFTNDDGVAITEIQSPFVAVTLSSPWPKIASANQDTAVAGEQTVLGETTAVFKVNSSTDDVNQDGNNLDISGNSVWLGTGRSTSSSWTGLRFSSVSIPKGATIKSAKVRFYSPTTQWLGISYTLYGDNTGNSTSFSNKSKPSQRSRTSASVSHSSNERWSANGWYTSNEINSIVKQIVNRSDWKSGNSLSIIVKGSGNQWGRKFITSYNGSRANAPQLVVTYESTTPTVPTATTVPPTATRVPPTSTSVPPTSTPIPPTATKYPTPTIEPATTSVDMAEDSAFTKNVKTVTYSSHPLKTNYTFSSSEAGRKTLYVRFKSNTGQTRVFSNYIDLVALPTNAPSPTSSHSGGMGDESMALHQWQAGAKNAPNPTYDKCDDGTDVSLAHKQYYVVAYDGKKYPTWHPPVVTNPLSGVGKCYFGHEHGSDPQKYLRWNEVYQHFGKDLNGDGTITAKVINSDGTITPGDHAGIPFGIANEHMDLYYNQEGRDSIFVRHEDHVGHKIEIVNAESEMVGNTTHPMAQLSGTTGINIPYYKSGSNTFQPTGVTCAHLHKFHQGTHSADAILNNLHETIFHSECTSVNVNNINAPAYYPNNSVILTGMMAFGKPGEYKRFCFADRTTKVCAAGTNADGSCRVDDPLLSKLPDGINSISLGRNMVDRYCLENWSSINPGNNYFAPYEIWEGDLMIQTASGDMLAEHGRQWDVLDPIRFVDPESPTGYSYNASQCAPGGAFDGIQYIGGCNSRSQNTAWDSPQSGFRGLKRTTYFGRNRVSNPGGSQIWWTDPLGGNAVTTQFSSGLKQKISTVEADIQKVQSRIQQLYGGDNFLNDRAIQRQFNSGGNTVHAPN